MALSWISAFKAIPWGEVLAATPSIVQGAERLWGRFARQGGNGAAEEEGDPPSAAEGLTREERLQALEAQVVELQQEAKTSSQLIKSLAEQNLQLVRVVDGLRQRTKSLVWACAGLGAVSVFAVILAVTGR